jgi:SAM-dependent methyltransferase
VRLDGKAVFNRILDNEARTIYRPAIAKLFKLVPDLMARKIPEANVQQAFTLDTVVRFAKDISCDPKILCIGSFEDSALWGLRRLNFQVDDVDPVLNFELGEFMQRPTTVLASYDIIFSVSVIEHVQDDAEFLIQIGQLLKPGGIAVLTCDYNDQYVVGGPKPSVDWRLYTQNDFRTRLLPRIADCELMDLPQWDCLKPDFQWEGCSYTFASLVFRKK